MSTIGVRESATIGCDCFFAEMVSIRDHDHGFLDVAMPIGSKATITRGVHIGQGAIVGANSVVTHDVAAGTIV